MIYYPLQMLQLAGISEVLIVTGQKHAGDFVNLLGDGRLRSRFGEHELFDLNISYRVQTEAGGIAEVVGMARNFIHADEKFILALGDNIIEQNIVNLVKNFSSLAAPAAAIALKEVDNPERFGVARFDKKGKIVEIVEKPGKLAPGPPPSNWAQTGIYMYDDSVFEIINNLKPSQRGELEITDVNNIYIKKGQLHHYELNGWWRDVGTIESLSTVGQLIAQTGANNI